MKKPLENELVSDVLNYLITISADLVVDLDYKKSLTVEEEKVKKVFDIMEWISENKPELFLGSMLELKPEEYHFFGMLGTKIIQCLGELYYSVINKEEKNKYEKTFVEGVKKIENKFIKVYTEANRLVEIYEKQYNCDFFEIAKDMWD